MRHSLLQGALMQFSQMKENNLLRSDCHDRVLQRLGHGSGTGGSGPVKGPILVLFRAFGRKPD